MPKPPRASTNSLSDIERAVYLYAEREIAGALFLDDTGELRVQADRVAEDARRLREHLGDPDAGPLPPRLLGLTVSQLWSVEAQLRRAADIIDSNPPYWEPA